MNVREETEVSRFFVFVFIALALATTVLCYLYLHKNDNTLRFENVHWRVPGEGELGENTDLERLEELVVSFSVLGATPNSDGFCKLQILAEVSGPAASTGLKCERPAERGGFLSPTWAL